MTKNDIELYDRIKRGDVPCVRIIDMPIIIHSKIESSGIIAQHTINTKTEQVDSLSDLLGSRLPLQMIYIYPVDSDTPYHQIVTLPTKYDPRTFESKKGKTQYTVKVARGSISCYQEDIEYKRVAKLREGVLESSKSNKRLLLLKYA